MQMKGMILSSLLWMIQKHTLLYLEQAALERRALHLIIREKEADPGYATITYKLTARFIS